MENFIECGWITNKFLASLPMKQREKSLSWRFVYRYFHNRQERFNIAQITHTVNFDIKPENKVKTSVFQVILSLQKKAFSLPFGLWVFAALGPFSYTLQARYRQNGLSNHQPLADNRYHIPPFDSQSTCDAQSPDERVHHWVNADFLASWYPPFFLRFILRQGIRRARRSFPHLDLEQFIILLLWGHEPCVNFG